jgi:ketol-acid reductoisomerase
VEAGYQPEVAYYECLHELKLITDLIWEGGIERMHFSISDTAEYGSHAVGPNVVDEHVRDNMRTVLAAIRDGSFAREWIAEMDRGQPSLDAYRRKLAAKQIEQVGARLRALNVREEAAEVDVVR